MIRLLFIVIIFSISSFAKDITVYVNSPANKDITEQRWQPTIDLLNKKIPQHRFTLLPIRPSQVDKIRELLDQKKIDFLITQPAITTILQHTNHISIMLTMVTRNNMDRFGSVFLVKKDSPINTLKEIKNKSVAAVSPLSFGGWLAGYNDLYELGIDPLKDKKITFMDGSHKKVIESVLAGEFDVGVVKTGMLEQLSEAGLLDINKIKVLNEQKNYPIKVSSTLYPEWSLSRAKDVDEELANMVFKLFNTIDPTSQAAIKGRYSQWHLPQSHVEIDAIFKKFRLGHYEDLPKYDMKFVMVIVTLSVLATLILAIFTTMYFKTKYLYRLKKELEDELQEKEKMLIFQSRNAAIGEMIGMIAHQWRQPLSSVSIGINNIILDHQLEVLDCNEMEKDLHKILKEIQKLSQTIDEFKHLFSMPEVNQYKKLSDILNDVNSLIYDSFEKIDVKLNIEDNNLLKQSIFPHELQQVVLNILKNSYEAFVLRKITHREITIKTYKKDSKTTIEIEDNAGGIEEDILYKMFEPYYTTKNQLNGAGLGLYVAKSIMENILQGSIEAKNTTDGVKFILSFKNPA